MRLNAIRTIELRSSYVTTSFIVIIIIIIDVPERS